MGYEGFFNLTAFAAQAFFLSDEEGATQLTLIAKGTYDILQNRAGKRPVYAAQGLELSEEQRPIVLAPVYRGEPGVSSLRFDTEVVFAKAATDVVLLGHALA